MYIGRNVPAGWKQGLLLIIFMLGFSGLGAFYFQSTNVDIEIKLKAIEGMKYDKVRFVVPPGSRVRLTLENADEMAHNLLITKPGAREEVVLLAESLGREGPTKNYIPNSKYIFNSIPVLKPGQSKTIEFDAPEESGIYPYVCTYPGHGRIMYGAMYVTVNSLPPIIEDVNVPEQQRNNEFQVGRIAHPYPMQYPELYRTFMPNASPAAIAVALTPDLSYCWDAGSCRLRYAWQGGFVDNFDHWKGNGNSLSKIVGNIFYQAPKAFPFRLGNPDNIQEVSFLGYSTLGYPEFHYRSREIEIKEMLEPLDGGSGLKMNYEIQGLEGPLYMLFPVSENLKIECKNASREEDYFVFTPENGKSFSIILTEKRRSI